MRNLKTIFGFFACLYVSSFWANEAHAQVYLNEATAEYDDGFVTHLSDQGQSASGASNGFVSNVQVGLKWTFLLGQVVESYTLKWERSGLYNFPDGRILRRSSLVAHPDLLARFDAIKPTDMVMKIDLIANTNLSGKSDRPNFFGRSVNAVGHRVIRKTPHFVIGAAGIRTTDIVPSSPQSYAEFIQWNNARNGDDLHVAGGKTIRNAVRVYFRGLRVQRVELPVRELDSIYRELAER